MDDHNNNSIPDARLVQLSLGDNHFFAELIGRYEPKLSRYIKRITHVPREDHQDILQNVFIKAYTNLNDFDTNLSFNSWIYRITRNEVIDWSRRHKTKIKYGQHDVDDEIFDRTESFENFLKEIELQEDRVVIRKVLSHVDWKFREILVLRFLEEKSYQEIGDILKKPTSTVGTLVRRAKEQFKDQYKIYYGK